MVEARHLPMERGLGKTDRIDDWWKSPLAMGIYLGIAVMYATWRGFMEADFWIFGGQKLKILKIRDSHLVEKLICIQLALTVCRLLYCLILYDFLNSCHFFIQNGIT